MNNRNQGFRVKGEGLRGVKVPSTFALSPQRLHPQKGFALLITLVVVSVVLAIGLSLLFITTKQYVLAITAVESEKAFQAAQIGLECMRFHRQQPTTRAQLLRDGGAWPPPLACGSETTAQDPINSDQKHRNGNQNFNEGVTAVSF